MFKVGDKVLCINGIGLPIGSSIVEGNVYIVKWVNEHYVHVQTEGSSYGDIYYDYIYSNKRFKLVETKGPNKIISHLPDWM